MRPDVRDGIPPREPMPEPGPARILVVATIVVPGDHAMPLADLSAFIAQSFREGGCHPVRVDCEFIEETARV